MMCGTCFKNKGVQAMLDAVIEFYAFAHGYSGNTRENEDVSLTKGWRMIMNHSRVSI